MRTVLLWVGVAAALWAIAVGALLVAGRRTAARELALLVPNLVLLFKDLVKDPRVPRSTKLLLLLALAWFASPIDLLPEFLPLVGPLDDAVVAWIVLRRVVRAAGHQVVAEHWRGSETALKRALRALGVEQSPDRIES